MMPEIALKRDVELLTGNSSRPIYVLRGKPVMLDVDLARLYEIETFNLNKAVKRNMNRLPPDFMFQLKSAEWEFLKFQFGMSKNLIGVSMRWVALFLFFFASITPTFAAYIYIDHDKDDCKQGWISMDVSVRVNGESFSFDPSCRFSFDKEFQTKAGLECKIQAGMCSSFSPYHRLEVSCEDGSRESVQIECEK